MVGIENVLKHVEIKEINQLIVTLDVKIDLNRFVSKKVEFL